MAPEKMPAWVETVRLVLRACAEFPNLRPGEPLDAFCYSRISGDR